MNKIIQQIIDFFTGKRFKKQIQKINYPIYYTSGYDMQVFMEINKYRLTKNLNVLSGYSTIMDGITASYPTYLIENNVKNDNHSFFDQRVEQIMFRYKYITRIGENIGYGYTNPKSLVAAWIKSDGHRKTMEGNYIYLSVASVGNYTNTIYMK